MSLEREINNCVYLKVIYFFFLLNLDAGKKFWNLFHLQPMRDQKVLFSEDSKRHKLVNF